MSFEQEQLKMITGLLSKIYCDHSEQEIDQVACQLMQILNNNNVKGALDSKVSNYLWDSSSVVLIAYPDAVYRKGETTLKTLNELLDNYIGNLSSIIHILPFLKSTSDGGFAVSNHEELEDRFGSWNDLKNLSDKHFLMADLVLNHVSSSHKWVQQFIQSTNPGYSYILSPEDNKGWEKVIRPRNSALMLNLATKNGFRNAWTTFGPDQIDLDWHNPFILVEFLKLISRYISNGVRWIRLDAVAFIWKQVGTSCIHRDEVHHIVRLLRIFLDYLHPSSVVITETNVPEKENISYLRTGDEAHMAYNFPLPPLLLESLLSEKADLINSWLNSWPKLPKKTSLLNFTASHDGIGLRALEGLMDQKRFHQLLVNCEKRGGLISHRKMENGEDCPYELNISWWSAMAAGGRDPSDFQVDRFLLSQLFTMALQGVPAFYLQAILASENDVSSFSKSGERRDLNRERFEADKLFLKLEDSSSSASHILTSLNSAMKVRSRMNCFHPESSMKCLSNNRSDIVIFTRGEGKEKIWAVHNMTRSKTNVYLSNNLLIDDLYIESKFKDCLTDNLITGSSFELSPYNVQWIKRFY